MMKWKITSSVLMISVLIMSGCGGGGGKKDVIKPDKNDTVPQPQAIVPAPSGIDEKEFKVVLCTSDSKDDDCNGLADEGFDLSKNNVLVLKAPEDIGTSKYYYFDGKRYGVVPKEEVSASPVNMLAHGLALLEGEPSNYKDAKAFLKKHGITGEDGQNKAIMNAISSNLEGLGKQGVPLKQAYDAGIKAMAERLLNLTVKGLSGINSSGDGETCILWSYGECVKWADLGVSESNAIDPSQLLLDKKEAAHIAMELREKSDKPNAIDAVFEKLSCKDSEDRQIYMYGVYDSFVTTNPEPTTLSADLSTALSSSPYLSGYDVPANYPNIKIFADTHGNLPTNLTQGVYAIGLKEGGIKLTDKDPIFVDKYFIGDAVGGEAHEGNVSTLRNTWDSVGASDVYYRDLSSIMTTNGQSLLSRLQGGQNFLDTITMMTTNVDFVAIGACVPKQKPDGGISIKEVPTKLVCNEEKGEEYWEVIGGIADDFASPVDTTTPSAVLSGLGTLDKYDQPTKKTGNFADTLAHPGSHITQVELTINTRPSAVGSANDNMYVGKYDTVNPLMLQYDPNVAGISTLNGGTAHQMYGGATLYGNGGVTSTLLTMLNSSVGTSGLDVMVLDQTEVDTIRLSMCIVKEYEEPCLDSDGDGVCDADDCDPKDPTVWEGCDDDDDNNTIPPEGSCNENTVQLDLRPATSWTYTETGTHPDVGIDSGFWDSAMNWFSFDQGWEKVHNLEIDFCACGTTNIRIDEMKSDNLAKIYLDTDATPANYTNIAPNDYLVTRTVNQHPSTMNSTASNESAQLTVAFTGSTPQNHTLHFDVKNGSGSAGGAVDGTLEVVGHLGKCTDNDTVGTVPDENDTITVNPDLNWTVVHEGTPAVIADITWVPSPDGPAGNEGNGTIVIDIAGPIIATNPAGKPFIDNDPEVVINVADLEHVGLSDGALVAIDHLIDPPQYERDPDTQIVTDHSTGLHWQDDEAAASTSTLKPWLTSANYNGDYNDTSGDTAATYCAGLALGGHTDWRLPSKSELLSIVDFNTIYPAIDTSVFVNTASHYYWSSATRAYDASYAWIVNFYNGYTSYYNKSSTSYVRCVR